MVKIFQMAKETDNDIELSIIPKEAIISKIFYLRGKKVMFDKDLAMLYQVETKALKRAVNRNRERFPEDFMFILTEKEAEIFSRYQIGTLKRGQNIKYLPYVFTEQGVAMLSSILRSNRAIQVNIQIIRTFTKLREILLSNKEFRDKIERLEISYNDKLVRHDQQFKIVFETIKYLMADKKKPKREIGFKVD